jgi:hypothetical protein
VDIVARVDSSKLYEQFDVKRGNYWRVIFCKMVQLMI